MSPRTTDINHGHPSLVPTPRTPPPTTDKPQVAPTDTTTDTTDTPSHGHDLPVYIQGVGPADPRKTEALRAIRQMKHDLQQADEKTNP